MIAEKIANEHDRAGAKSLIHYQAALALAGDDTDAAARLAERVENPRQGALIFSKIAGVLVGRKDTARAAEVLGHAMRQIGKAEDTLEKAHAMLTVSEAAAAVDPDRGFEALGLTVKAINRADSRPQPPGARGAEKSGAAIYKTVPARWSDLNFERSLTLLARADFDRALLLAGSMQKKEAAVQAQIAVCRGALLGGRSLRPRAGARREGHGSVRSRPGRSRHHYLRSWG